MSFFRATSLAFRRHLCCFRQSASCLFIVSETKFAKNAHFGVVSVDSGVDDRHALVYKVRRSARASGQISSFGHRDYISERGMFHDARQAMTILSDEEIYHAVWHLGHSLKRDPITGVKTLEVYRPNDADSPYYVVASWTGEELHNYAADCNRAIYDWLKANDPDWLN